jgi:hypothetical protein
VLDKYGYVDKNELEAKQAENKQWQEELEQLGLQIAELLEKWENET